MRSAAFSILCCSLLFCCSNGRERHILDNHQNTITESLQLTNDSSTYRRLQRLSLKGDFNGDGKPDQLSQHLISKRSNTEIEMAPDPFQTEWDSVITWLHKEQAHAYLYFEDTLHLGPAQGLYCLLNLGDLNKDGTDEIAFVIDLLDFSNINTCHVYTLCKGKWTALKGIKVHESAFNYVSGDRTPPTQIKEYLEKKNGQWMFLDYLAEGYDNADEVGKMKPLIVKKCK